MRQLLSPLRHSALSLAVLGLVALSPEAACPRDVILFKATFDQVPGDVPGPGQNSGVPAAEVGMFGVTGTLGLFEQVTVDGEGMLHVEGGTAGAGALIGKLGQPFVGREVRVRASVFPTEGLSARMSFRVEDDDGGVLIDVDWGHGAVAVGSGSQGSGGPGNPGGGGGGNSGAPTIPYELEQDYKMVITLRQPLIGLPSFTFVLHGTDTVVTWQGPLEVSRPLSVNYLRIVRPEDSGPGAFLMDDLIVATSSLGFGIN